MEGEHKGENPITEWRQSEKFLRSWYFLKKQRTGWPSFLWEWNMPKEEGKVKWYLTRTSVILSLFFVLGPFGLPLLYKSPRFSKKVKIILTIVVIIYSSYLVFASLEIVRQLYRRMEEFQGMLG